MNKKLLICGAIAAGLLLTACVKKEAPKEDEQRFYSLTDEEMVAFFQEYIINKFNENLNKVSFRIINGGKK